MFKVLVTGGTGFLGSRLAEENVRIGNQVEVWDLCERETSKYPIYGIDMNDEKLMTERLRAFQPDIIFHCAGSADVRVSVENPKLDFERNVCITHNLLFGLHKLNMHNTRLIFLSSAAVYGNPISLPIKENMEINPLSPYALHKAMCEHICTYFRKNYGVDARIARIFSAYGAGLKKQIFWDMYQKINKTSELNMFGTGRESRDYIHVDDVVQALNLIANQKKSDWYIYNVANGEETQIRQVAELFARCAEISEDKIHFDGNVREGDPLNWCADITRLKSLGYHKSISIHTGVSDYYKWVSKQ